MSTAVVGRMQTLQAASGSKSRISLTELARSNKWRSALKDRGVLEVVDRTDTAAFLVSQQGMADLLGTIEDLESQLERAEIASMVNARAGRQNWLSGEELASQAWDCLLARKGELEAASHVD